MGSLASGPPERSQMPSLGPAEILVIFVVALLVFGPDKLPEIGRQVGRGVRELRRVQATPEVAPQALGRQQVQLGV